MPELIKLSEVFENARNTVDCVEMDVLLAALENDIIVEWDKAEKEGE